MQLWQPTRGILQPNQHWRRGQGAAAGFSAEAQQFISRVTLSGADQIRYATLIDTIVASSGLWAKIGNLKIYKAPDAATSLVNLKSSSYPTDNSASLTFTAGSGYTGSSGLWLEEPRSTEGTTNSMTYFSWTTHSSVTNAYLFRGGQSNGISIDSCYPFYSDGRMYIDINSSTDDSVGKAVTPAPGMYGGVRDSSTNITYFQNGVNRGTRTDTSQAANTTTPMQNQTFYPGYCWGWLHGAALTDAEVLVVHNAFAAF